MFTVLKNLANLMTIAGDWYFYGLTYSWQVRAGATGEGSSKGGGRGREGGKGKGGKIEME